MFAPSIPSDNQAVVREAGLNNIERMSTISERSDAVILPRFYERDMDILLAEEFQVSPAFANWFLSATKCAVCKAGSVLEVAVSKSDNLGESDLVVLFESVDKASCFALFVEDKIDAPLQPEQMERYRKRAEMGQQKGSYSHFHVVLCAPTAYAKTHKDAAEFDAYVSYESIADFLRGNDPSSVRNLYRAGIFANVASKVGHVSWVKETDSLTDSFWQAVYDIAIKDFPDLEMKPPNFASGTTWITFRPRELPKMPIRVIVDLKSARGYADLTFSGILCGKFAPLVSPLLEDGMSAVPAGASTVIRLNIPSFGVSDFDSTAAKNVRAALQACTRLVRFYREHRHALDSAASNSLPELEAPPFVHRSGVSGHL